MDDWNLFWARKAIETKLYLYLRQRYKYFGWYFPFTYKQLDKEVERK